MTTLGKKEVMELNPHRFDRCHKVVLENGGKQETFKVSDVCLECIKSFIQMDMAKNQEATI